MIPDHMLWGLADNVFDHVVVRTPKASATSNQVALPVRRRPTQLHLICPNCGQFFEPARSSERRCRNCGFLE